MNSSHLETISQLWCNLIMLESSDFINIMLGNTHPFHPVWLVAQER